MKQNQQLYTKVEVLEEFQTLKGNSSQQENETNTFRKQIAELQGQVKILSYNHRELSCERVIDGEKVPNLNSPPQEEKTKTT